MTYTEAQIEAAAKAIYYAGTPSDPKSDNDTDMEEARFFARAALAAAEEAGFVTTVEALEALPVGSVVMEMTAEPFLGIPTVEGVFHKFPIAVQEPGRTPDEGWRSWYVVAGHGPRPSSEIDLPARILYVPVEGSEG